jgi:hypothetical protein
VEGRTRLAGRNGEVLQVWSCDGHAEGLESAQQFQHEGGPSARREDRPADFALTEELQHAEMHGDSALV